MADATSAFIRTVLDGAFLGKGWQGPTLSGALRGVSVKEALFRPGKGRRCIWQHVLHAAYWKHRIAWTLSPDIAGTFDRSPSNWPKLPRGTAAQLEALWKADRAYLAELHARLVAAAATVDPGRLAEPVGARKWTFGAYLAGAAAHDAYHLGQVQLIKRLAR